MLLNSLFPFCLCVLTFVCDCLCLSVIVYLHLHTFLMVPSISIAGVCVTTQSVVTIMLLLVPTQRVVLALNSAPLALLHFYTFTLFHFYTFAHEAAAVHPKQ